MSALTKLGYDDERVAEQVLTVARDVVSEVQRDDTVQVSVRMGAGYYMATIYSEREATINALEESEVLIDEELSRLDVPAVVTIRSKRIPSSASSQRELRAEQGRITIAVAFTRRLVQTEEGIAQESAVNAANRQLADIRQFAPSATNATRPVNAKGDFVWINLDLDEYRKVMDAMPPHVIPASYPGLT
jgi:hypothetical protein